MKVEWKTKGEMTPFDRSTYSCLVNGNVPEKGIELLHSREVAMESAARRAYRDKTVFYSEEASQNRPSARTNIETGKTLDKGIQLYRLWFRYLKLALELEEMKVSVVVKNQMEIRNHLLAPKDVIRRMEVEFANKKKGKKKSEHTGGDREAIWKLKQIERVKVKRSAYKGWDLDQVLTQTFDNWWKTHSHIFEGYAPTFLNSKEDWVDNDDFIYIRIDKTSQRRDIQKFLNEEISIRLKGETSKKFKISGKSPRVNVIQNNYNALVLTLKGWSPKEILYDNNIYIRKTDDSKFSSRGDGLRPKFSTDKSARNFILKNKMHGVWHLLEVCNGRFGVSPPSK